VNPRCDKIMVQCRLLTCASRIPFESGHGRCCQGNLLVSVFGLPLELFGLVDGNLALNAVEGRLFARDTALPASSLVAGFRSAKLRTRFEPPRTMLQTVRCWDFSRPIIPHMRFCRSLSSRADGFRQLTYTILEYIILKIEVRSIGPYIQ